MKQQNYLLIGLGGTGCAVVRELKKKLYIEWRSRGNSGPYPEVFRFQDEFGAERMESRIATLSIDSNEKDLQGQGERSRKWHVFGETLKLGDREKVLIDPTGIDRVLGSVERYPGMEPWIREDLGFVGDITRGSTEPAGCNQIRRMGRLALANGNSIENVIKGVAHRLDELSRDGQVDAEIHVACTLAAGTGSGSVIDVVAQVQHYLQNRPGSFNVFLHGFATAKDVGDVNTGNFYANQYAALLELNAFRLAIYEPWDIKAPARLRRLAIPRPGESTSDLRGTFKSLALITDTTEGGTDVPLERQIESVAEFIFQMAVRQMGDVPKVLRDAFSMEDRAHYPTDVNGGNRSTAFIGYGVQRVAIPEREIREKLSYSFGRQFLLKLLYNNWDNGYRDQARHYNRAEFVDGRRGLWGVTKEHLCLDLVEDATGQKQFASYETEWSNALTEEAKGAMEILGDEFEGRKEWLMDFERRAKRFWQAGFRSRGQGGGVVDYFKIRRESAEIRMRARTIRGAIERDLIENLERLNADYALHHLPAAIEFLIQRVESDRLGFGELAPKTVENAQETDRHREEIRQEYAKVGRFAKLIKDKHISLLEKFRGVTTRHYYWRTLQHAVEYGQEFSTALIDELKSLQHQITVFDTRIRQIAKEFQSEIDGRIRKDESASSRDDLLYLVDANYVNDTIRTRFEGDKSMQDLRADVTIKALAGLRGDRIEFAAYNEQMPVDESERVGGRVVEELRRVAETNAVEAHRRIRESDNGFEGIFGQNIVRKLYNDHGGKVDGNLEEWLRERIDKAMPMVSFDPAEERMEIGATGPVLYRCIFVPKCKAVPPEFEQQLRRKVESIKGAGGACKEVNTYYLEVPEDRNPTEIAIISVAFFFSARFTRVVHGLKKKYLQRLDQRSGEESRRAYFEVHTESHNPRLPDLMKLGRREVLEEQLAPVILATALDLMRIPENDGEEIFFGEVDSFGRVQNKVESGMRMTAVVREAATDSEDRFGHAIPIAVVALYSLYIKEFREEKLTEVAKLAETKMADVNDLESLEKWLDTISGQAFLLAGSKENDQTYALFDVKAREAAELARRLANKSAL